MPDVSFPYPLKGLHQGTAYSRQPEGTTTDALNERSYDPILERARGGQRNGTTKFHGTQINSTNPVQFLDRTTALDATATVSTVNSVTLTASVTTTAVSGMVADPLIDGVFYCHQNATITPNLYKLDEDLVESWAVDITSQSGADGLGNNNQHSIDISSDGLYLFVTGEKQAAGHPVSGSVNKNLWVVTPSTGAIVTSTLVVPTSNTQLRSIRVVKRTNGLYRMSVCSDTEFIIIDWNASDLSFTEIYRNSDPTTAQWSEAMMHPANEDIVYARGSGDNKLRRFNIASQAQAWEIEMTTSAAGGNCMEVDNNGNIYIGHNKQSAVTLLKYADNTTSASLTWSFDNGTANNAVWGLRLNKDQDVLFVNDATNEGSITIDPTGDAATTLVSSSSWIFQDTNASTGYAILSMDWSLDGSYIQIGATAAGSSDEQVFRVNPANIGRVSRKSAVMAISGGTFWQVVTPAVGAQEKTQMGGGSETVDASVFAPRSVEYAGKFYICDGSSSGYAITTPEYSLPGPSPTSAPWALSDGSLPTNGAFGASLIALYRGRITLSGVQGSEQNIWFSKVGDPLDFNASPSVSSAIQPVILNTGTAGVIGDIVNTLIPHNDDILVIGGDHTIHVLRGDPSPRSGGRIDLVTDVTGMWFGNCWVMSPNQRLYFMGTDGVYRMQILGDQITSPENITKFRLDEFMYDLRPNRIRVLMAYDLHHGGVHVFFTPIASVEATHLFYCERTDSWHKQQFPTDHGPLCVLENDGDEPKDRTVLIGGRDGYVRRLDPRADDDDGTAISSHVVYPPYKPNGPGFNQREASIRKIGATLGANTDALDYEVRVADDAESVLTADPEISGTWTGGGRQSNVRSRASGGAISLKLSNTSNNSQWAVEEITATIDPSGPIRV